MTDEERLIGEILEAIVNGVADHFEDCTVRAFDIAKTPDPKDRPWIEIDLRGWDLDKSLSRGSGSGINAEFELRIFDCIRDHGEKKNISTGIRGLALRAQNFIRSNDWGLANTRGALGDISVWSDSLDQRINQEELWVVRWFQGFSCAKSGIPVGNIPLD